MASRKLTLQQLAQRVVHGDSQAALVLADAMMDRGMDKIETGRVRKVPFIASTRDSGAKRFLVSGRETLYNVPYFAVEPTDERWRKIFTQWVTTKRDVYHAMVRARLLPTKVGSHVVGKRFGNIIWEDRPIGERLQWDLYDATVRTRVKRPIYIFNVARGEIFGRLGTFETHFDVVPRHDPSPRARRRRR